MTTATARDKGRARRAYWHTIAAIVRKDITVEMRERVLLGAMLGFALIVLLLFSLALQVTSDTMARVLPGVLWVTFTFAGMLGLGRSFVMERDQECLDGLLLAPCDLTAVLWGKIAGNLLLMALTELVTLVFAVVLFDLRLHLLLVPVLLLGTLGFATVGTFFSAVSIQVRARELLLPVLVLPLMIPALIASTRLTGELLSRGTWAGQAHWLHLLVAFDVIYLAIVYMTFEAVMEE
ncbi:MAG: heme exporter protein CcmB [Anaerolineae bacterium]|nr:heme exporter protein CcmB [Anaerolineae bacterium]